MIEQLLCTGCGLCQEFCLGGALTIQHDWIPREVFQGGWFQPIENEGIFPAAGFDQPRLAAFHKDRFGNISCVYRYI
jgi:ferredoxin